MANSEHLEILKRGVYIWNQWRERNPDLRPDLRGAYLREADLERFNLQDADLRAAVLLGANVREARLEGADLAFSDLRFLEFKGACLHGAKLREAKGVTEDLRKATRPPAPWGKRIARALAALLLLSAAGYLYRNPNAAGEITAAASEKVSELWARNRGGPAGAFGDAPEDGPGPDGATMTGWPSLPPEAVRALEADLGELRLPGWTLAAVEVRATVLALRVDQPTIDQEVYIPTLAAACGAVVTHRLGDALTEIRVLNRAGDHGWAFQEPRACEVLIETTPTVLRMAAASDSIEIRKPRPGRE